MPANVTRSKNLRFTSDYPIDKVVFVFQGQVSVAGFGFADIDTPHNLVGTPLVNAQYTTDPTWALSYEIGSGLYVNGSPSYSTAIAADSTNVRFSMNNNLSSPVTLYYRVYGFSPTDNPSFTAIPTNIFNTFKFNTDFNYPKLYLTGNYTEPSTGGAPVLRTVVTHSLGYIPQVSFWQTAGTRIVPVTGSDDASGLSIEVTTTQLIVTFATTSTITVFWRIYLDE